jgi:ferrous iron transport protein B
VSVKNKKGLRVVLAGNPNAGKTTLFNSLTFSNLKTGNFHGVTTSAFEKVVGGITFVDTPGVYDKTTYSLEEVCATDEIEEADIIINVVDALTLENSINLTNKLLSTKKPVVLWISKLSELKKRGGRLDIKKLESVLGVPVYSGNVKQLLKDLKGGNVRTVKKLSFPLSSAYYGGNSKLSTADKFFYNKYFALFVFLTSIITMFLVAFHPAFLGAYLKGVLESLLTKKLPAYLTQNLTNEGVISLVDEGICAGAGGVLSFVPQIAFLYLFLTILDESGITSALSFATDGLFERVNLSGRAAFSLISGFGCTAAAISTTRGFTTKSAQKRTIAVLAYIPCGAKMPVFLTFLSPLFENPFLPITCLYFLGIIFSLTISSLLKGSNEDMLSEVTPIIFPSFKTVVKKLYFYLRGFIIKVTATVTLFCIISWFFSHFSFSLDYVSVDNSMLAFFSKCLLPLFYPMGVTDWRVSYSALCGIIAKENVTATIAMLMPEGIGLDIATSVAMSVFILLCPACISAFSSSMREVGVKFTLKCYLVQTVIAFLGGYLIHLIFIL